MMSTPSRFVVVFGSVAVNLVVVVAFATSFVKTNNGVCRHLLCDYDSFKQPHGDMNDRAVAAAFLRHIRRDKSAKRIFAFLSLNFCFMSVPCSFSAIWCFCDRSLKDRIHLLMCVAQVC